MTRHLKPLVIALTIACPSPLLALDVISCLLEPSRAIAIGTPVPGIITEINVGRGDAVSEGEILLRIDARVEEAQLAAARFMAQSEAIIETRRVQVDITTKLFEQAEELTTRGVATRNQFEEQRAEKLIAEAQLREAIEAREAARLEVLSAEAALEQRIVRSPIDGIVLQRSIDVGELAGTGGPLLDLVSVDVLHAELLAPSSQYGEVALGQSLTVTSENAQGRLTGTITAIDPVIDAASRSFGFRVELDNASGIFTAGNRCDLAG